MTGVDDTMWTTQRKDETSLLVAHGITTFLLGALTLVETWVFLVELMYNNELLYETFYSETIEITLRASSCY